MTLASDRFELASNCVAEEFGDEVVAINFDNGRYYSLRGLAFAVWQDLLAGHAASTISERLAGIDGSLATTTGDFIGELERHGLVRRRTNASPPARALACVDVAEGGCAPAVIEVFDDMADLIKADPIHEVDDEVGWPVRRETPL